MKPTLEAITKEGFTLKMNPYVFFDHLAIPLWIFLIVFSKIYDIPILFYCITICLIIDVGLVDYYWLYDRGKNERME